MPSEVIAEVEKRASAALRVPGFTETARLGYAGRAGFYLVLAGLVVQAAVDSGGGKQANGHGALSVIAGTGIGLVLIALAALGFLVLGVERLVAAVRHKDDSVQKRLTSTAQGLFYCGLTVVPASYLGGDTSTGTNRSQHRETAQLLGLPAGREIVIAVGVVVAAVCLWQIRTALSDDFMAGLEVPSQGWLHDLALWSGRAGIVARALVFLPLGGFLVYAGATFDAARSDGLDVELSKVAREPWGVPLLVLVAVGLLIFAVYSAIEAAYRDVSSDA